jgi:peptidoglycan/LPS O-acetylase OafA/YrhL
MSGKSGHLDALTGIRGIAAWLVVLYHTRRALTEILPSEIIDFFAKGYLAVDLFFMLSGFVIWYNYADRLRGGGGAETLQFLWRRFTRVWPLHGFMLAVYLAFFTVLVVTGRNTDWYPLAEIPLHFALVQNWGFTEELTWNHPAWSISTEVAAYLLFPLVVLAARWDRLSPRALLALAGILVAGLYLTFLSAGHAALGDDIPQMGLWRCLFGFALGNVLCLLWQHWREQPGIAPIAAATCAALVGAGFALKLDETLFVPAAFFAALLALACGRGWLVRLLSSRPLLYLGEISYSTYLGHYLLWQVWKIAFVDDSIKLSWPSLAGLVVAVFASSALLYHCVEKPAQRWLNARPPRWLMRPAALPAE